ncbi:MAG TPA: hypothetical protein VK826_11270 [Bacteroidia bacterium]|nr:hypothetical protein [Bacteroidia bacterium]
MKWIPAFLLFAFVCSCKESGTDDPKGIIYDSLAPYRDSLENAITAQDTTRVFFINAVNKECEAAPDSMEFRQAVHIAKNDLGFVRVRTDASCFEVDSCFHNLLGTIKDDQWIWAQGPVKEKHYSVGHAFVICVKDAKGKYVKGYLSNSVLDVYR